MSVDEDANIDLYGDINIEGEKEESNNPNDDFGITNSPPRLNRFDSILDIHTNVDFEETDLPESESEAAQSKQVPIEETFVTLPEPSKWERDEESLVEKCKFNMEILISFSFYNPDREIDCHIMNYTMPHVLDNTTNMP